MLSVYLNPGWIPGMKSNVGANLIRILQIPLRSESVVVHNQTYSVDTTQSPATILDDDKYGDGIIACMFRCIRAFCERT